MKANLKGAITPERRHVSSSMVRLPSVLFVLALASIYFGSCTSGADKSSGKEVFSFSDTTWRDGKAEVYDEHGRLTDRIEFNQGIRHGWHVHYREDGTVDYRNKYHQGQLGGTSFAYYPNGDVEVRGYWLDGKQFGQTVWFTKDGTDSLRGYYDFDGEGFCSATYLKSRPEQPVIDGLAVSPAYWDYPDLDSLTLGDTCSVQLAIATFPGMRTEVKCYLDNTFIPLASIDSSMATVLVSPQQVGRYQLRVEGSIRNEVGTVQVSNQFKAKVLVVP